MIRVKAGLWEPLFYCTVHLRFLLSHILPSFLAPKSVEKEAGLSEDALGAVMVCEKNKDKETANSLSVFDKMALKSFSLSDGV